MPPVSSPNRKAAAFHGPRAPRNTPSGNRPRSGGPDKAEHEILFQTYFKSVGPRTYAAQVKKASNDNHYLVLTEGKRDEKTGEVKKARVFVYSEDFVAFFRMLQETAQFIRANPVPEEVKKRRDKFWARKQTAPKDSSTPSRVAGATSAPSSAVAPPARPSRPSGGPAAANPSKRRA